MYLAKNIRFLRKRKQLSQTELSEILNTNRSVINNYEREKSNPPIETILQLSDFFHISTDTFLRVDLSELRESQLYLIENGSDIFVKGSGIRVLATTVDSQNKDNIELVPIKAKAGYTTGFFDPEFIGKLPSFKLPFLDKDKKYRTFQISGESMLPIPDKSWVTGEFIQDFSTIKNDELYIILTINEGIVFKKVKNELSKKGSLNLISLNTQYKPYDMPIIEIREVWKFIHYISSEIPENYNTEQISSQIDWIKNKLEIIEKKIETQKTNRRLKNKINNHS